MANTNTNTNLTRRFLIELNGQFVSTLSETETANLAAKREEKSQATMGDRDQAAIFTLQNGLLLCSSGVTLLVLGRLMDEEEKFEAMPMYWASQFEMVKAVQYTGEGDGVELESFEFPLGALLDEDGETRLYACPPTMIIGE
ncbi:uncharacterized protein J4E79_009976 [Alternaria viburni]|uniref:uncharacterized protein n=1 Tax=Alternaria viburni TaxID=566460 RepID=UPI0020C55A70|nr:uncharacterized protein J4E79_009976 [Alternaria viburni]KAI4648354.1 hypothetical protein J4E79_009976 [Alternaria viburni]